MEISWKDKYYLKLYEIKEYCGKEDRGASSRHELNIEKDIIF